MFLFWYPDEGVVGYAAPQYFQKPLLDYLYLSGEYLPRIRAEALDRKRDLVLRDFFAEDWEYEEVMDSTRVLQKRN